MPNLKTDPTVPIAVFVAQFVEEGLGNAAHLVGSKEAKVAALIDPLRDVDRYLDAADEVGVKIAYVLDTHLHNDFVSGAREIAERTGAIVGASADAGLEYDHKPLRDGDRLPVGDLAVEVIATPGHTPEHVAYALWAPGSAAPSALFSGGALIVGGCARTDLLGAENAEPFARNLYHSVHDKLLRLPDAVALYPTHGAGSFCAAPSVPYRQSTIGQERRWNALVQAGSEDEFVERALDHLGSYPAYFRSLRAVNQRGPKVLGGVPRPKPMSPNETSEWTRTGGAILDVRPPPMFYRSHIPGAYGIWAQAPLTVWAGWLLPFGTSLALVAHGPGDLDAAVRQLIRIGFDDIAGHLEGGMPAWEAAGLPTEKVPRMTVAELRSKMKSADPPVVLDVRQEDEWSEGHIPDAVHIENGQLPWAELPFPKGRPIVIHCASGNRSTSGYSVLRRRGYEDVTLLDGGFGAWQSFGFDVAF